MQVIKLSTQGNEGTTSSQRVFLEHGCERSHSNSPPFLFRQKHDYCNVTDQSTKRGATLCTLHLRGLSLVYTRAQGSGEGTIKSPLLLAVSQRRPAKTRANCLQSTDHLPCPACESLRQGTGSQRQECFLSTTVEVGNEEEEGTPAKQGWISTR